MQYSQNPDILVAKVDCLDLKFSRPLCQNHNITQYPTISYSSSHVLFGSFDQYPRPGLLECEPELLADVLGLAYVDYGMGFAEDKSRVDSSVDKELDRGMDLLLEIDDEKTRINAFESLVSVAQTEEIQDRYIEDIKECNVRLDSKKSELKKIVRSIKATITRIPDLKSFLGKAEKEM